MIDIKLFNLILISSKVLRKGWPSVCYGGNRLECLQRLSNRPWVPAPLGILCPLIHNQRAPRNPLRNICIFQKLPQPFEEFIRGLLYPMIHFNRFFKRVVQFTWQGWRFWNTSAAFKILNTKPWSNWQFGKSFRCVCISHNSQRITHNILLSHMVHGVQNVSAWGSSSNYVLSIHSTFDDLNLMTQSLWATWFVLGSYRCSSKGLLSVCFCRGNVPLHGRR
jgi:hypothetical protein